jgi:molecular chaperone DnaK (HSP70)
MNKEFDGAIGIDLGTKFLRVGVWEDDSVTIISNEKGSLYTPSYISFTEDEILIGEDAKNQIYNNPSNTIYDIKRLLGRKFDDIEVLNEIKLLPYKIINKENKPYIQVQYKEKNEFSTEEITSLILLYLKKQAENYLKKTVKRAVVSCPAYFSDSQKQSIKEAGKIVGLEVLRVIKEPVLAAISYGLKIKK